MSSDSSIQIDASALAATLESAMQGATFTGWDTTLATAFTGYGIASLCFAAFFLQRGNSSPASLGFKIFFLCTGLGYGLLGAATQVLNSYMEDGKAPGAKLGDDNALHLIFWIGVSLIPMGAAGMMVAGNATGNGASRMMKMAALILGLGATAMAALTVFLEEPIAIDFLKMTMNETMLRFAPTVLAVLAQLFAVKGIFLAGGENATAGNKGVMGGATILAASGFFYCFGVSDDCEIPAGAMRDAGSCPFPADFNENAILNCCVIVASALMFFAGKAEAAAAAEDANMATVVCDEPKSAAVVPVGSSGSSSSDNDSSESN